MIKFLYFRDVSTLADDDATNDSVCWPASSLMVWNLYMILD